MVNDMRRLLFIVSSLFILFSAVSCGNGGKSSGTESAVRSMPPAPAVPSFVSGPAERAEYLVSHYWKAFFDTTRRWRCDSSYVMGVPKAEAESGVGMYVTLLEESTDRAFGRKELARLFASAEACEAADTSSNALEFFVEMMAKYLYDPNSPVRDEDLYQPFVAALSASPFAGERQPVYEYEARMCSRNAVGTPAADIVFTGLDGRRRSLYSVKAERTLLFFTNPGCPACREIISLLREDGRITALLKEGRLAVVAVYIDQEIDQWKAYAGDYPSEWLSGYDQDFRIRSESSYHVRAIPSLYLLDRDKTVLLKDAPKEKVMNALISM